MLALFGWVLRPALTVVPCSEAQKQRSCMWAEPNPGEKDAVCDIVKHSGGEVAFGHQHGERVVASLQRAPSQRAMALKASGPREASTTVCL